MVVNFHGNQFFMDFVRFLLYAWYNVYSAWLLSIRILICSVSEFKWSVHVIDALNQVCDNL